MYEAPILNPKEIVEDKPFTDPERIVSDVNTLRFMIDQLCLFMESEAFLSNSKPPVIVHQPNRKNWFYRLVIAKPDLLMQPGELTIVGFLGHKQQGADMELATEFDETLVNEIPDYPGLLSYSSMAMVSGDYSNLVVFTDSGVKKEWSRSKAHDQAVRKLSPDYYESIKLYNGKLPVGIKDSRALELSRIKYFDYVSNPRWHAVREFPNGSS